MDPKSAKNGTKRARNIQKYVCFFLVKNENFPWGANPAVKQTTRKDRVSQTMDVGKLR